MNTSLNIKAIFFFKKLSERKNLNDLNHFLLSKRTLKKEVIKL